MPLRTHTHVLILSQNAKTQTQKTPPRRRQRAGAGGAVAADFARLQEGCTVGEIAAHEGLTPPRVRQILVEAAQSKRPEDRPDHVRMQIARLAPALKGLVASATSGETEDVPVLLRALAQLDRYARENFLVASPSAEMLGEGTEEHSAAVAQSQARLRERRALERSDASRVAQARPLAVQRRGFYRRRFGAGERDFGERDLAGGRRRKRGMGRGRAGGRGLAHGLLERTPPRAADRSAAVPEACSASSSSRLRRSLREA